MVDSTLNNKYAQDDYYVNHFQFNRWRDIIADPYTRFHTNFSLGVFDTNWLINDLKIVESHPYPFTITRSEYQAVHKTNPTQRISIIFEEFESVAMAHEAMFNLLRNLTNPNVPVDPPAGWSIGDIYKCGYWSRDNILISFNDLSTPALPIDKVIQINKAIDNQLTDALLAGKKSPVETPKIESFSIETNKMPLHAMASLHLKISDKSGDPSQLYYRFSFSGGRIIMKNGAYFFVAYEKGTHTISLVVRNTKGLSDQKKCSITVEQ